MFGFGDRRRSELGLGQAGEDVAEVWEVAEMRELQGKVNASRVDCEHLSPSLSLKIQIILSLSQVSTQIQISDFKI